MEDVLQVFGDMMGHRSLHSQESQGSMMQPNQPQAHNTYSYRSISFNSQQIVDTLPFGVDNIQHFDQLAKFLDKDKDESMNSFAGIFSQPPNGENRLAESGVEKTKQSWQRIKWTDEMVRVLISVVSYVVEIASSDHKSERNHHFVASSKGKWRSISNLMVERGYYVSPQQCEDKFNDLNKKFKRLNDLLGDNASSDVIENPLLLESMSIPDQVKEEVRRILTCKQLFYQEMSSYHEKNTKLPHDDVPLLQPPRSDLNKGKAKDDSQTVNLGVPAKRRKHEDKGISSRADTGKWLIDLKEKKLRIQKQMLELKRKKLEWLKFCQKEDRKLEKMRLENESMKLENERLRFEFDCKGNGDAR